MRVLSLILETLLWTGGCFFLPALCVKALFKAAQKVFKTKSMSGCSSLFIALAYAAMTLRTGFSVFDDMGLWIIPFWIFWMVVDLFFFCFVWNT